MTSPDVHRGTTPLRGLTLLGTDTGVGKTSLGVALLELARRRHRPLLPFKPAETGVTGEPSDASALLAASGVQGVTLRDVCPFPFAPPVAPLLAARLQGQILSMDAFCAAARKLAALGPPLLVETAGGVLTPYAPGLTAADLATALGLPVVLVARNALGTVNHTALALAELQRRRLPLAGVVLVETDALSSPDRPYNAELIQELTGISPLGTLRHVGHRKPGGLADALGPWAETLLDAAYGR